MADTKISNLAALTAPVDADELVIVDKSDTTMAASGTDKRITHAELLEAERTRLDSLEAREPSITFSTPGPPGSDGDFTGQLALGKDPADQTVELWRWDGAVWVAEIGAPPFVQVSKAAQSVTSTATTSVVDFDTADEDPDGLFSLVDNFATIERPGVYYINAKVTFATSSATGVRLVEVRNAAGVQFGDSRGGVAQTNHKISTGGDLRMAVGDFLWVQVAQTSGSTMNVSSVLSARWVRP